jgi:hypothetical protein
MRHISSVEHNCEKALVKKFQREGVVRVASYPDRTTRVTTDVVAKRTDEGFVDPETGRPVGGWF